MSQYDDETRPESERKSRLFQRSIFAILLSVLLLVSGNGLLGNLLGVRAGLEGMARESLGLMMSAYFAGFMLGSIVIPRRVQSVGHIRTFAAFASIASAIGLAHILFVSPGAWMLLRILHGFCYAGVILVVESWLNGVVDNSRRGQVLSLYQLTLMIGWTVSQMLLNIASPAGFSLFLLISIFLSLSLVPVTIGRITSPGTITASRIRLRQLFVTSPLGVSGIFVNGLVASLFFGMGPVFAHDIGLKTHDIALFMAVTMLGAVVFQWPLGWLSDHMDRRQVIIWSAAGTATISFVVALHARDSLDHLLPLTFLFGALSLPIYSVCVAHVNDHVDTNSLVATAGGLILVYGAGSVLGPFVASLLMGQLGPSGVYVLAGTVELIFVLYGVYRLTQRSAVLKELKQVFVPVPQTTHVAAHLDKRGEPPPDKDKAPE